MSSPSPLSAVPPTETPTGLGVDVGGTKISGALVDDAGRITRREQVATPADDTAAIIAVPGLVVITPRSRCRRPSRPRPAKRWPRA